MIDIYFLTDHLLMFNFNLHVLGTFNKFKNFDPTNNLKFLEFGLMCFYIYIVKNLPDYLTIVNIYVDPHLCNCEDTSNVLLRTVHI